MKTKQLLLTAALSIGVGFAAVAGTEETVVFTATVPNLLELTTTSNTAGITINSNAYNSSDSIESEAAAAHQLAVRSNRGWIVSAKSGAENFSFTPSVSGDTRTKPAGDLAVRKAGDTYQAMSTTNVSLATGTAGGAAHSGNTFAVDYKIATDLTLDPPGSYALDVVYTLTAP